MNLLFLSIGFGLVTAAIVALSAVAVSLQVSVNGVPNFAHGELLSIAAFGAVAIQYVIHQFWIEAVGGLALSAAAAWLLNKFVLQPFIRRGTPLTVLLVATAGASLVLQNVLVIAFGPGNQVIDVTAGIGHKIGPFRWTTIDIVIMVIAGITLAGLHVLLRYTNFGTSLRAVADSRTLAEISGINAERVVDVTWLIAGAISGVAGLALATSGGSFGPYLGSNFLLVTFSAAIIGGIGRPYGAMVGGLIIGLVTEVSAAYVDASYKQVFALALLVLALLFRPQGLLRTPRGQAAAA
jgi:branched-chain amino acid transport system permease protein